MRLRSRNHDADAVLCDPTLQRTLVTQKSLTNTLDALALFISGRQETASMVTPNL